MGMAVNSKVTHCTVCLCSCTDEVFKTALEINLPMKLHVIGALTCPLNLHLIHQGAEEECNAAG